MPEAPVSSLVSGGVPMMWYRACDLSCWCVGREDTLLPADTCDPLSPVLGDQGLWGGLGDTCLLKFKP